MLSGPSPPLDWVKEVKVSVSHVTPPLRAWKEAGRCREAPGEGRKGPPARRSPPQSLWDGPLFCWGQGVGGLLERKGREPPTQGGAGLCGRCLGLHPTPCSRTSAVPGTVPGGLTHALSQGNSVAPPHQSQDGESTSPLQGNGLALNFSLKPPE